MMLNNWKYFLSIKRNWLWLFFQSLILFVFFKVFELVIQFSHYRHSVQIKDWLFIIQPLDLSLAICIFTYSGILIAACYLIRTPEQFFNALNLLLAQNIIRAYCIYLVPLAPPEGMIYLNDPFLAFAFYKGIEIKTDLFFSGHVSNLFLLALIINERKLKYIVLIITATVGIMLIIQRVHYSLDVISAPVISWIIYKTLGRWLNFYTPKFKETVD